MKGYVRQKRVTPTRHSKMLSIYLEPALAVQFRTVAAHRKQSMAALAEQAIEKMVMTEGEGVRHATQTTQA